MWQPSYSFVITGQTFFTMFLKVWLFVVLMNVVAYAMHRIVVNLASRVAERLRAKGYRLVRRPPKRLRLLYQHSVLETRGGLWRRQELREAAKEYLAKPASTYARHRLERALEAA